MTWRGSGWTLQTLAVHLQRQIDDHKVSLDERYATQTKAVDAAFVAADKAVQAALTAAEKAVVKAEGAAEKRFESVNEFRATLSDQAATFPSRAEVKAQIEAQGVQVDAQNVRIAAIEAVLQRLAGQQTGAADTRAGLRLDTGWLIGLVGAVLAVVAFVTR